MNSISFACPLCSGVFQVEPQQEASQVYCPHCNNIIDIPSQDAISEQGKTSLPTSQSEPKKKPKRSRKRAKKKSAAPVATNNADLFPPGYVPESPVNEASNSTPEPVTPEPVTPEPVTPEPVTPEPGAEGVESLLPPGVNAGSTKQPASTGTASDEPSATGQSATIDHLLPASVAASTTENPFADLDLAGTDEAAADSETPQIALLDPVKTVAVRGKEFELKQRTPEEKSRWRRRKNMVMWTTGILILLGTLFTMTR